MVDQFTMRPYEVKQGFRFVEGTGYIERVVKFERKKIGKDLFYIIHAHSEMSNHLIYHDVCKTNDYILRFIQRRLTF